MILFIDFLPEPSYECSLFHSNSSKYFEQVQQNYIDIARRNVYDEIVAISFTVIPTNILNRCNRIMD